MNIFSILFFYKVWEKKVFRDRFMGNVIVTGAADNEVVSTKLQLVGRGSKQSDRHPGELKITTATYDDLNAP